MEHLPPLRIHGHTISLSRPVIMGVLNTTPDSFYDGGKYLDPMDAVIQGMNLVTQGAHIIDVGGESTRPGSTSVSVEEELIRIVPVIHALAEEGFLVSVDTMKSLVAEGALEAGAIMVNDISGGRDPEMFRVVEDYGAGLVIGHMRGMPETMQNSIDFSDVIAEVERELMEAAGAAIAAGINRERIILDPGIGFGKTPVQCAHLLGASGKITKSTGFPVLVGPSNKSFIGSLSGAPVDQRLPGTITASILAYLSGAKIFRVHDPGALQQALAIAEAILPSFEPCSV
ncbi:dihydropteroate synthase [Myxococcota bacterium]|nr:dihydropteroate synthase [Myxococcota bacterium]